MDGKWLVSGGTDGKVQVWNVSEVTYPSIHMQVSFNTCFFIILQISQLLLFVFSKVV